MPYQNPVLSLPRVDHGDPSILRFCGRYYLYHTGTERVPVYVSTDLVHWEPLGTALEASRRPGHWAQIDLWAPEVIYENGLFYMYVAGAQKRDGRADDEIRRIGVAVAERPEGPFRLADEPLTDEWSIDAHPFKDADGTYYLFYNVRNELTRGPGGVIGCGNVVDRMLDLRTLAGRPSLVCRPELPHEGNLEGTWFWNEGPFVLRGYGRYYQMYSGGCYYQPTYHVAFAQSPICHGADAPARGWTKEPSP
ncbi:MAG: family 43 glycosylhydrolase, partial [Bacteroidota bacterium]